MSSAVSAYHVLCSRSCKYVVSSGARGCTVHGMISFTALGVVSLTQDAGSLPACFPWGRVVGLLDFCPRIDSEARPGVKLRHSMVS